jgi:hypothetical protein
MESKRSQIDVIPAASFSNRPDGTVGWALVTTKPMSSAQKTNAVATEYMAHARQPGCAAKRRASTKHASGTPVKVSVSPSWCNGPWGNAPEKMRPSEPTARHLVERGG